MTVTTRSDQSDADRLLCALLSISAAQRRLVDVRPRAATRAASSSASRQAIPPSPSDSDSAHQPLLWEGGFFLVVLIGGMAVLTRTLRHDAELRRRQQNFLAAVSHEFKSPLASIQLAAETLVLRSRDDDSKRLGTRILEDGERLLAHDRQSARHHAARGRPPTPDAAAHESARARAQPRSPRSPSARARAASTITLAVADDLALHVDPVVVETGLRNLLDNASKSCVAAKSGTIDGARHARRERHRRSPSATTGSAFRPRTPR